MCDLYAHKWIIHRLRIHHLRVILIEVGLNFKLTNLHESGWKHECWSGEGSSGTCHQEFLRCWWMNKSDDMGGELILWWQTHLFVPSCITFWKGLQSPSMKVEYSVYYSYGWTNMKKVCWNLSYILNSLPLPVKNYPYLLLKTKSWNDQGIAGQAKDSPMNISFIYIYIMEDMAPVFFISLHWD